MIVRRVAAGGMGELYEARQTSTRRVRALKVMHEHIAADPALRARFAREATVVASVTSEHIVEVLAAGMEEDGLAWIAMEWLDGVDLATHLRDRRRLSPAAVSALVAQLGHALSVAHAAGIVHRDLKPENIFLARSGRADSKVTVKLLDFGIARVLAEATVSRGTSTLGSPLWMAPEQYDPDRAITPAADVWSLGLVVFRALTGKHYLRAAHAQRGPTPEGVMSEVLLGQLPPASQRARELGCEAPLPLGFDGWFEACVARSPEERFGDGGASARALVTLLGEGDASELVPAVAVAQSIGDPTRDAGTVPQEQRQGSGTFDGATRGETAIGESAGRTVAQRSSPSEDALDDRSTTSTLGSSTSAAVLSVAHTNAQTPARRGLSARARGALGALAVAGVLGGIVLTRSASRSAGQRPWFSSWAGELRARYEALAPRVRACVTQPGRGPMRVLVHYRADGSYDRAHFGPTYANTSESRCVEAIVRSVQAPATGGGDATLPYTFDLWGPAAGELAGMPMATSDGAASDTTFDASPEDAMRLPASIIAGAALLATTPSSAQVFGPNGGPPTSARTTVIDAQLDRMFVVSVAGVQSYSVAQAGALDARMHPNGQWLLVAPQLVGSHTLSMRHRDGTTELLRVDTAAAPAPDALPAGGILLAGRPLRVSHTLGACRVVSSAQGPTLVGFGSGACHVLFDNGTLAPVVEDYSVGPRRPSFASPPVAPAPVVRAPRGPNITSAIEATAPALRSCMRRRVVDSVRVSVLVAPGGRMSQVVVSGAPTPRSAACMTSVIESVTVSPASAGLRASINVSLASGPWGGALTLTP
ncbi:MAG: serine/threonine protein kinase [Myxococcales bacterium]|nr:serine/threonine protein kinase [Myxococcales bacterium]